jgi:hypothetical protein
MLGGQFQNSLAQTTMTTRLHPDLRPIPSIASLVSCVYIVDSTDCFLALAWLTSRVLFGAITFVFHAFSLCSAYCDGLHSSLPHYYPLPRQSRLITPHLTRRANFIRPTGSGSIACAFEQSIELAGLLPSWTRATSPSRSRPSSASCTACSMTLASPAMSATRAKQR